MFSERLKELRKQKGLSQKEIAQKIDVNIRTFQEYEYNKVTPSIDILKKICIVLQCSSDYLLGLSDKA